MKFYNILMFINLILIIITIMCVSLIIIIKMSCNCIDNMDNTMPLYLDRPSKLFDLYFPYINIKYINSKIATNQTNIDTILETIPDYETNIFNILTDKKYDNIYKGIFDIKPEYNKLYNIFYAYMLNRKNSKFTKSTDVNNKYIIKKLFNDTDYLYIVPFTGKINNINSLPTITNYDMIDTVCKKDNKYIECRIKITPEPKNFQLIEDKYYQDIIDYFTSLILVDIIKIIPVSEKCYVSLQIEEKRQAIFRTRLSTTFINVIPPIITTSSIYKANV